MHPDEPFEPMVEGPQITDVSVTPAGIWSVTVAVGLWLPSVAVTVAVGVLVEVKVPVVAANVALLCPDITVTLEGTPSAALLLDTAIAVFEVADWLRETVQVDEVFEPIEEGAQFTEASVGMTTGTWSVRMVDGSVVPSVAEIVALAAVAVVNVFVVAENVVLLWPECTDTLTGTVTAGLLLCNMTEVKAVAA